MSAARFVHPVRFVVPPVVGGTASALTFVYGLQAPVVAIAVGIAAMAAAHLGVGVVYRPSSSQKPITDDR